MALLEAPMEATMATLELTMDNDTIATLELTMDKGGETDGGITTGTWYLCSREKQRLRPMPAPSTLAIMALLLLEVTTEATMATLEVTMDNGRETDGRITTGTWYTDTISREKRRLR